MIRLMLGRRMQGKTTLAYFVGRQSPRRMIFDPRGMIRSDASTVVGTQAELATAGEELLDGRITELVVTPASHVEDRFAQFCRIAAAYLRAHPYESFAILIDEVRFIDVRNEDLDWIMRTSDVDRAQIIFTGHRPKDIPPDIRAIADTWCLFQFTLRRDLDVIEEQTSPAVARSVQGLKPRCFVEWNDQIGAARAFSDPSRWYVRLRSASVDDDTPPATRSELPESDPAEKQTLWD